MTARLVPGAILALLASTWVRAEDPPESARVETVRAYLQGSPEERGRAAGELGALDGLPVAEMERLILAALPLPNRSGLLRRAASLAEQSIPYVVRLPASYDPVRPSPLLFWFHGPGTAAEISPWTSLADWILVAPALPADNPERKGYPKPETGCAAFRAILIDLAREIRYDPDRVVVGGFSHGGMMAYWTAAFLPDRVAGGVVGGAYGIHRQDVPGAPTLTGNLVYAATYVFHGDQDRVVPVAGGREAARELKSAGCEFVYRELPGVGHELPPGEIARIAEWLPARRRRRYPRRVVNATSCRVNPFGRVFWVRLLSGDPGILWFEGEAKEDNRIEMRMGGVTSFELLLCDRLVDFGKEIVVVVNGQEAFRGRRAPSARALLDGYLQQRDPGLLYSAVVPIRVK